MATTLPREIIRWMQSLDLSYSIKDPRKDLSNGFTFGEIMSRYFPDQIQMHSFDNSQKKERKLNNWTLLQKAFEKVELPLGPYDYQYVLENNDLTQLIDFTVKFYMELTGKKVNRNAITVLKSFNNTLNNNEAQANYSQSFLLKDKGLEALPRDDELNELVVEDKKGKEKDDSKTKGKDDKDQTIKTIPRFDPTRTAQLSTSIKLKTFIKYENKPIMNRPELSSIKFEVKSTNIRPLNLNVSRLRAAKDSNTTLNMTAQTGRGDVNATSPEKSSPTLQSSAQQPLQQTASDSKQQSMKKDKLQDQTVYDILEGHFRYRLAEGSLGNEYRQFVLKSYPETLTTFSESFNYALFKEIYDKSESICSFILRDLNETWKFVNFMLGCLKYISIDRDYFRLVVDTLKYLGERSVSRDPVKSTKIIKENFLQAIYNQLVTAQLFEKKENLAAILYSFVPSSAEAKRQVILAFKEVAKDHKIFMETLAILLISEKNKAHELINEEGSVYLNLFLKYAKAGVQSSHPVVKTMSLSILSSLSKINYEIVFDFIRTRLEELSLEESWEDKCQIIMICSQIISGLVNSESYFNFVKKNTMNYTKNYSFQNEMAANKLKDDIKLLGDTIIRVLLSKPNNYVVRVFIVYCVDICHEVQEIMDQIVAILVQSNKQFREWFFTSTDEPKEDYFLYNDRSLRYKTGFVSKGLKRISKEFLLSLTDNVRESKPKSLQLSHF